jgi:archaellum component FlaC
MQKSDQEFIEKYKQKQFEMRHPVPQKVTKEAAAPVAAVQEVIQEADAPVAVQEAAVPVAAVQKVVQKDEKENIQKDINDALQLANELNSDANPLEIIKSALQQINYALRLLERETKKVHIVVEQSEPEVHNVVEKSEQEVHNVVEKSEQEVHIVVEKSEQEVHNVVEQSEPEAPIQPPPVPASAELVSIDHISDVDVDEEKEEEFKIVMPKKSKTKKVATATLLPVQEKAKKDEFPSLGSSFAPVKTGFWSGTAKKSLEIAKAIAHIPSPPPISSLKKSIGMVRSGPSKNDHSEEEYSDTTDEYHIQKRYGEEDDDNWE